MAKIAELYVDIRNTHQFESESRAKRQSGVLSSINSETARELENVSQLRIRNCQGYRHLSGSGLLHEYNYGHA